MIRSTMLASALGFTMWSATATGAPQDAAPTARSPVVAPDDLSSELAKAVKDYDQPAIAAAVVRAGRIIAIGIAGTRIDGKSEPVERDDRFHIGSCTKSITATLAALLVEEGKITWETTVVDVFPDLKGKIKPAYERATLAQLLSHTAGVATYTAPRPEQMAKVAHLEESPRECRRAFVEVVLNEDPLFTPGEKHEYSNAGYGVATAMLEQVADARWEDLLSERLFKPLGMTTAHRGWPNAKSEHQPWGHFVQNDGLMPLAPSFPYKLPSPISPAGDLSMSIEDFAKWAQLHLTGLRGENDLLKKETFAKLHEPIRNNYALGWLTANIAGERATLHNGSAGSFFSLMTIFPEKNLAIVVITNAGSGNGACNAISRQLFEKYGTE